MTARMIDRRVRTRLSSPLVVALIAGLVLALVLSTAGAHDVQAQGQPPGQGQGQGQATNTPGPTATPPGQSGEAPGQQRDHGTPAASFAPGQTGDTPGQQQQATRTAEAGQSGQAPTATSRPGQGQGQGQGQGATPTPRSDRDGQGNRDDQGSGSGKGIEKLVVSVNGTPVSAQDQGRGQAAPEVPKDRDVVFSITVNGTPPGNSGRGEIVDNIPPHLRFISAEMPQGVTLRKEGGEDDPNKVVFQGVQFSESNPVTIRVTLRAEQSAPCNSVATNVGHVNGIGSDQAQVRITCPAPATPTPRVGGQADTPTPTVTLDVDKTADANGQPLNAQNPITNAHLGKNFTYNILVQRNGGSPARTIEVIDTITTACPEFVQIVDLRSEMTGGNVGSTTITDSGCTIRVAGDAKDIVGNRLHVIVKVAEPDSRAAQNPPPRIINRVTVSEEGGPRAEDTHEIPVNVTPPSTSVSKVLQEGGQTVTEITPGTLGKTLRYNILLQRRGGTPGRTEMAFRDLISEGCIDDGSGLIRPLSATVDQNDLGIGDEFSIEINGCTISGRVVGDNKGNLDPTAPGNQFHVHIEVQVAQPGTAVTTTSAPRQVVNQVNVSIPGGGPTGESNTTVTTPVNLGGPGPNVPSGAGGGPNVPGTVPGVAGAPGAPGTTVNLPSPGVSATLVSPVNVAGVQLAPGQAVTIQALPPGTVLRPSSSGEVTLPSGAVLGVSDVANLPVVTVQQPTTVRVAGVQDIRAPLAAQLPQTGGGPAAAEAVRGVVPAGPMAAFGLGSLLVGLAVTRLRRWRSQ